MNVVSIRRFVSSALILALVLGVFPQGSDAIAVKRQKPSAFVSSVTVRKPRRDHRKYQYGQLENGLKVLAVEDPHAAKSGFAVAVSAGSFYDPPDLPGLAHFCEHLLFLGTKKYPDESSFDTFLSQHDGSNNAYTTQERTVYYNEVSHAGFDEGVDRFAQFFVAPLFRNEMVGRELEAVNSEHQKNIPNQGRRFWELMRSLAGNVSVLGRFYTGTTESLKHGNSATVAALKKYHAENYCAPRMRLVLISNRPTAKQLELAKKHFSAVQHAGEHCSPSPRDWSSHWPFDIAGHVGAGGKLRQLVEFRTDSAPQFWMMFPLHSTLRSYAAQPGAMLQYMLGYAGPGSLKSNLKKTGLASGMEVQVDETSVATLVFIVFDLTPQGASRSGAASISSMTFQYLAQLRGNSRDVIQKVYPTMQKMSTVTFDNQEAPDTVMDATSSLAEAMLSYAPADVLTGDTVIDSVNLELMEQLVQRLAPEYANFALATKHFDEAHNANRYEKFYGFKYAVGPAPEEMSGQSGGGSSFVLKQSPTSHGFLMPPPLRYVPDHLAVLAESAGEAPRNLGTNQGVEVWWLGKGRFDLPKAQLRVRLAVPRQLASSAQFAALRRLHVELTRQGLEEPMEDLSNCGLEWDLDEAADGYHVSMDGYDEHIPALVQMVSSGFATPPLDAATFKQAQQRLLQSLEDKTAKMPYEHAMEALDVVSSSGAFSTEEILVALRALDKGSMEQYLKDIRGKGLQAQLLVTGNVGAAKAKKLGAVLAQQLGLNKFLGRDDAARSRVLKASRPVEVRMRNPISGDVNSATINAYQFGVPDVSERVKLLMLGNMFSQKAYDTLRTQQQLGYVVFGEMMPHHNVLELRVIVQGAKQSPDAVDGHIENLLQEFRKDLKNISSADFQRWKASLRSTISKHDENMGEEADRLWGKIVNGNLCFNQQKLALQFLDTMQSPQELSMDFQRIVDSHMKFSVRLFGASEDKKHLDAAQASGHQTNASLLAHSTVVINGDSIKEKQVVLSAERNGFWPDVGVCQIHRTT